MRHWRKAFVCGSVTALATALACEPTGGTDGNTSWLGPCGTTPECGLFMECMCGACSAECTTDADCAGLDPNAVCAPIGAIECTDEAATSGVCSLPCEQAGDCAAGAGCIGGYCWPGASGDDRDGAPEASVSPDAGAGGTGGSGASGAGGSAGVGGSTDAGGSSAGGEDAGTPSTDAGEAGTDGGSPNGEDAGPVGTDGAIDAAPPIEPDAAVCVAPVCSEDKVLCGSFCTDPSTDEDHCGATLGCGVTSGSSGAVCDPGMGCILGACAPSCVRPMRPGSSVAVGDSPRSLRMGDVNKDGKGDLAVANLDSNDVSVLIANGDGTFQPAANYPVGTWPLFLDMADVTGDGNTDIVVWHYQSLDVRVLAGTGTGSFIPAANALPLEGRELAFMRLGDVDGDCKVDLVSLEWGSVFVYRGMGDGTFGPGENTGLGDALKFSLDDLNGDHVLDLALPGLDARVALGRGDGTFDPAQSYPVGAIVEYVSAGDMNRDGIPDLVTANRDDDSVGVALGNGDGTFQPGQAYSIGSPPWGSKYSPTTFGIGDLDGDGVPDVAVGGTWNHLMPMTNDGTGALHPGPHVLGILAHDLVVSDFNFDGRADVAAYSVYPAPSMNEVVVALGGKGTFDFAPAVTYPGATYAEDMEVADVDGKNGPDIILADYNGYRVGVLLGNGDGTFDPMLSEAQGTRPFRVIAGHLDVDGKMDLITTTTAYTGILVHFGNGNGTFKVPTNFLPGEGIYTAAIGDMNADTWSDIIVSVDPGTGPGLVGVLLGDGAGAFVPQPMVSVYGRGAVSLAVADVSGDGKLDVIGVDAATAAGGTGSSDVSVHLGAGDGTLGASIPFVLPSTAPSPMVKLADLDGDGHLDVIIGARPILMGTGGVGGAPLFVPTGEVPKFGEFDLADFDQDGKLDAAEPLQQADRVAIKYGIDGPSFTVQALAYAVTRDPARIATADFNGDGLADVVTANIMSQSVSVVLGVPVCAGP